MNEFALLSHVSRSTLVADEAHPTCLGQVGVSVLTSNCASPQVTQTSPASRRTSRTLDRGFLTVLTDTFTRHFSGCSRTMQR
ncbi:hypothetical protein SPLC1_S580180 [Arthrospira platensis C1]|nr:hypothetical protein SPLC1_S580180 [Arthrospira platensis C1]